MTKKEFTRRMEMTKELGGDPMFYDLLLEIAVLHARKNHDYSEAGNPLSNLRACERLGIDPYLGLLVRIQDKNCRIEQHAKSGHLQVQDETIEDSHIDAAVYNLLAIVIRRKTKKPLDKTSSKRV